MNSAATICVNGNNYENEECMPDEIRHAFEDAVVGALRTKRAFFQGSRARFVPPLNCRIVCDDGEFSNIAELSAKQRKQYEESLAALLPGYISERVAENEVGLQQRNKLFVASLSLVATIGYIWYHDCLNSKFLFHFIRFLCGLTQ